MSISIMPPKVARWRLRQQQRTARGRRRQEASLVTFHLHGANAGVALQHIPHVRENSVMMPHNLPERAMKSPHRKRLKTNRSMVHNRNMQEGIRANPAPSAPQGHHAQVFLQSGCRRHAIPGRSIRSQQEAQSPEKPNEMPKGMSWQRQAVEVEKGPGFKRVQDGQQTFDRGNPQHLLLPVQ